MNDTNGLAILPAGSGVALRLAAGQRLTIVNTHGTQVVDFWAVAADTPGEVLSMPHSRNSYWRLVPAPGDTLVTDRRRPILTLIEDTSPGVHDTLVPACDAPRYAQLGHAGHASCAGNLADTLTTIGLAPPTPVPAPLNLFMNVAIGPTGRIELLPPRSKAGDRVVFAAEMDCVVALSACPHDIFPVNGADCTPRDVAYAIQ